MTGKELNDWRKRMGWSVRRAAEEMGVSFHTLHNWLYAARHPIPKWVPKIAAALERIKGGAASGGP